MGDALPVTPASPTAGTPQVGAAAVPVPEAVAAPAAGVPVTMVPPVGVFSGPLQQPVSAPPLAIGTAVGTATAPPTLAPKPSGHVQPLVKQELIPLVTGLAAAGPLPVPNRFVPYYDVLRKRRESWNNFPAGLRVLVADNEPASLQVVEKMLKKCSYQGELLLRKYWSSVPLCRVPFPVGV